MQRVKKGLLVVSIGYLLLSSMAYLLQEKLIFLPTKLPQNYTYTFEFPFEEIFLTAHDGAELNALHLRVDQPKGVILYFHGNAGDLSRWGTIANHLTSHNYDVIVMDYRTYGKSTGALSEQALYMDAQLFYQYAKDHYSEPDIVLYGRSLGTGIATYLASKNQPRQLILETPYYSITDIAQKRFPFLPVNLLLRYKLPSNEFIASVACPVTIFHGTQDKVVAYESGFKLGAVLPEGQLKFYTIEDGGHNNLISFEVFRKGLSNVLE